MCEEQMRGYPDQRRGRGPCTPTPSTEVVGRSSPRPVGCSYACCLTAKPAIMEPVFMVEHQDRGARHGWDLQRAEPEAWWILGEENRPGTPIYNVRAVPPRCGSPSGSPPNLRPTPVGRPSRSACSTTGRCSPGDPLTAGSQAYEIVTKISGSGRGSRRRSRGVGRGAGGGGLRGGGVRADGDGAATGAVRERVVPVLVCNKVDRLLTQLGLEGEEVYQRLAGSVESLNVLVGELTEEGGEEEEDGMGKRKA
eukprot:Sspe_Gene.25462::Locus_10238_Transcript_7_8_Confidence_0.438_Length_2558::g.25462::m.25462